LLPAGIAGFPDLRRFMPNFENKLTIPSGKPSVFGALHIQK